MNTKTILMTGAAAALALPAGALADGSDDQSSHGKAKGKNHAQQQVAKQNHAAKAKKPKSKGFTLKGVDLTKFTVTNGALTAPFSVDPTAANRHARRFLQLTKQKIAGEDTVDVGTAGDAVRLRYVGLNAGDALLPTDRVKVIGKVTREGALDIRKITIKRHTESQAAAAKQQRQAAATKQRHDNDSDSDSDRK